MAPAIVYWSFDNRENKSDLEIKDTQLGIHLVDIELRNENWEEIQFTFFWEIANRWENEDFKVKIINN